MSSRPRTLRYHRTGRSRPMAAGRVMVVGIIALLVGALLNADSLYATASRQPFGWQRTTARAVVTPFRSLSHTLRLNEPRARIEESIGREPIGEPTVQRGISRQPTVEITEEAPPAVVLREGTTEDPLRVWVGGDSISEDYGTAVQNELGSRPGFTVTVDSRVSTGLTRPDYFDWPAHLADDVLPARPEVIMIMFGANDAQRMQLPSGVFDVPDAEWQAEYRNRVGATMDLLAGDGRLVIWVGQPYMRDPEFNDHLVILNRIYEEEAATRPWVRYLDSQSILSRPGQEGYAAYLPDENGTEVDARQSDGVHLSRFGASKLGGAGIELLESEIAASLERQSKATAPSVTPPGPPGPTTSAVPAGG